MSFKLLHALAQLRRFASDIRLLALNGLLPLGLMRDSLKVAEARLVCVQLQEPLSILNGHLCESRGWAGFLTSEAVGAAAV